MNQVVDQIGNIGSNSVREEYYTLSKDHNSFLKIGLSEDNLDSSSTIILYFRSTETIYTSNFSIMQDQSTLSCNNTLGITFFHKDRRMMSLGISIINEESRKCEMYEIDLTKEDGRERFYRLHEIIDFMRTTEMNIPHQIKMLEDIENLSIEDIVDFLKRLQHILKETDIFDKDKLEFTIAILEMLLAIKSRPLRGIIVHNELIGLLLLYNCFFSSSEANRPVGKHFCDRIKELFPNLFDTHSIVKYLNFDSNGDVTTLFRELPFHHTYELVNIENSLLSGVPLNVNVESLFHDRSISFRTLKMLMMFLQLQKNEEFDLKAVG